MASTNGEHENSEETAGDADGQQEIEAVGALHESSLSSLVEIASEAKTRPRKTRK